MHRVPQLCGQLAVFVCLLSACSRTPVRIALAKPDHELIADGHSTIRLPISEVEQVAANDVRVQVTADHGTTTIRDSPLEVIYRAGVLPGDATIVVSGEHVQPVRTTITLKPDDADHFADGTPDFLRLDIAEDRTAFRRWFITIAEHEASLDKPSPEINDCAALLRFAYREALRRHDSAWANDFQFGEHSAPADIGKYRYPYTPLGPRLFRTREGPFLSADLSDGTFAEFADAKTLVLSNAHFVTRDVHRAQPGDLVFYRQFGQHSPFHSMIFVGHSDNGPGDDWIVYHTGPDRKWPGEIRRVRLQSLLQHPDTRWRPLSSNPNFLGVYRWNILREAQ